MYRMRFRRVPSRENRRLAVLAATGVLVCKWDMMVRTQCRLAEIEFDAASSRWATKTER